MKSFLSFLLGIGSSLFSAFVMMKAFDWLIEPEFGFGLTYYQAVIIQFAWLFVGTDPVTKYVESKKAEDKEQFAFEAKLVRILFAFSALAAFWIISLF